MSSTDQYLEFVLDLLGELDDVARDVLHDRLDAEALRGSGGRR